MVSDDGPGRSLAPDGDLTNTCQEYLSWRLSNSHEDTYSGLAGSHRRALVQMSAPKDAPPPKIGFNGSNLDAPTSYGTHTINSSSCLGKNSPNPFFILRMARYARQA